MSFADLRQTVLAAHTLSTDYFGELVTIDAPDDSGTQLTAAVKIEAVPPWTPRMSGGNNDRRHGTLGEREWLRVTLNRNPLAANCYPGRPQLAAALYRAKARDADRRPFTFRGEIVFEGDQHAVYIFERPRIGSQGKQAGQ
jgi:hypothetical protein